MCSTVRVILLPLFLLGIMLPQAGLSEDLDYASLFEETENSNIAEKQSVQDVSFNGEHFFKYQHNFEEDVSVKTVTSAFGVESNLEFVKLISNWEIEIAIDDRASNEVMSNSNETTPKTDFQYLENFIKFNLKDLIFTVGLQEFNWGTGDEYNPSDNLNPKDLTEGLTARKIPIFSSNIEYFPTDSLSFQGVFIPDHQANIFLVDFEDQLNMQLDGVLIQTNKPNSEPSELGFKINVYLQNIDFSVGYIYGIDDFYTPEIELYEDVFSGAEDEFGDPTPFFNLESIKLVNKRVHHISADFKTILDRFGLWGEFVYTYTQGSRKDNFKIRQPRISGLFGLDYNFGVNAENSINFQAVAEYIPNFDKTYYKDYANGLPSITSLGDENYMAEYYYRSFVNKLGDYTQELLLGGILNLKWSFNNSFLVFDLTTGYFYPYSDGLEHTDTKKNGSVFITPEIDLMLADSFQISLGAEFAYSFIKNPGSNDVKLNREDRLGIYTDENNIFLKFQYKWNQRL